MSELIVVISWYHDVMMRYSSCDVAICLPLIVLYMAHFYWHAALHVTGCPYGTVDFVSLCFLSLFGEWIAVSSGTECPALQHKGSPMSSASVEQNQQQQCGGYDRQNSFLDRRGGHLKPTHTPSSQNW